MVFFRVAYYYADSLSTRSLLPQNLLNLVNLELLGNFFTSQAFRSPFFLAIKKLLKESLGSSFFLIIIRDPSTGKH